MSGVEILVGDCRELLATLPADSVHCVVTSPPYFGLRDYGTATWAGGDPACDHVVGEIRTGLGLAKLGERYRGGGHKQSEPKPLLAKGTCPRCGAERVDRQIGQEETPAAFIETLVQVFREVRRVLRPDGTLWLNMGDSYAGSWGAQGRRESSTNASATSRNQIANRPKRASHTGSIREAGLKPKDLMMIPARLALALQEDGWWLRSDIIWAKPNPMPESITDRPTGAHEHIFLLAKSEAYFYDAEAVKEAVTGGAHRRAPVPAGWDTEQRPHGTVHQDGRRKAGVGPKSAAPKTGPRANHEFEAAISGNLVQARNLRNVWTIASFPFKGAHFATFPPALVARCLMAGTSERGCCATCGAPWRRILEKARAHGSGSGRAGNRPTGKERDDRQVRDDHDVRMGPVVSARTIRWEPGCACGAEPVPCLALDPFGGSGTVGMVAAKLGRRAILMELNQAYARMALARVQGRATLAEEGLASDNSGPLPLFEERPDPR